jgi:hypothetical protein
VKAVDKQSRWGAGRDAGDRNAPNRLRQIKIRRCVMKTIRSLMTFAGLFVGFLVLGTAGAKGQVLETPSFSGTFTLPVQAQWGKMHLPAGEYTFSYGQMFSGGAYGVRVDSKAKGSPHGFVLVESKDDASSTKSQLLCAREGNTLIVRALELPAIGESISFSLPRGAHLLAQNGNHNHDVQLAQAPMLIERIPVAASAK